MSPADQDFIAWASRRHSWLWRFAYNRSVWAPLRAAARRGAVGLLRLDRQVWKVVHG